MALNVKLKQLLRCSPVYSACLHKRHKKKDAFRPKKRKTSQEFALDHFDIYYKPVFGKQWPSIRIALQSPQKYCLLLNSFANTEDMKESLLFEEAFDFMRNARTLAESTSDSAQSNDLAVIEAQGDEKRFVETLERLDGVAEEPAVPDGKDPNLHSFMPVTKVLSAKRQMELDDIQQNIHQSDSTQVPIIKNKRLVIPLHLQAYTRRKGDVRLYPGPGSDETGFRRYMPLDAGSLLPVLALDLFPDCTVLDMCAAPGIKTLTIMQTLLPGHVTCLDSSYSRMIRLKDIMKLYLPHEYRNGRMNANAKDAIRFCIKNHEQHKYDRVLVDVPCHTDRHVLQTPVNNLFSPSRKGERLKLQTIQQDLLYWGIMSCKPGGTIVYSTCTLSPPQNDGTVQRVLGRLWEETNIDVVVQDTSHLLRNISLSQGSLLGVVHYEVFIRHNRLEYGKAVHSCHGVVWSDGQSIYIAPVQIQEDHICPEKSVKLGQFEDVSNLYWSCTLESCSGDRHDDQFCYLCVVHKDTVSLWKVTGRAQTLSLKHVRKINASPLPQGCLWHPTRDILCILTKERGSFYFNHTLKKGSYALPPLESGSISCGCWSLDGKKLLLGFGTIILVYHWQDIEKSVSDYTIIAWKIPKVDGKLLCIDTHGDEKYVCTSELPLDKLCQTQENIFEVPDLRSGRKEIDNGGSDASVICGKSSNSTAHVDNLLSLKQKQNLTQGSSQVVLFEVQGSDLEPKKLCSQNVDGVISLDLLFCQGTSDTVVLGSNTQSVLQVFSTKDNSIVKLSDIYLGDGQRPSGLCGAVATAKATTSGPCDGVLVAMGTPKPADVAFPSSSPYEERQLTVQYMPLPGQANRTYIQNPKDLPNTKMFREVQLPNGNSKVHLLRISPLRNKQTEVVEIPEQEGHSTQMDDHSSNSSSNKDSSDRADGSESPEFNLVLPNSHSNFFAYDPRPCAAGVEKSKIMIIDGSESGASSSDLQTEFTPFQAKEPSFKNRLKSFFEQKTLTNGVQSSSRFEEASRRSSLSARSGEVDYHCGQQMQEIEQILKSQGEDIAALQSRISGIPHVAEKQGHQQRSGYSTFNQPDLVTLIWRKDGEKERRKVFLLDDKRLQLEIVKKVFGLETLEVFVGGVQCVVSCNAEGYIPLVFDANSTVYISGNARKQ